MKKTTKKLVLNKETVRNLNPQELKEVVGGRAAISELCAPRWRAARGPSRLWCDQLVGGR